MTDYHLNNGLELDFGTVETLRQVLKDPKERNCGMEVFIPMEGPQQSDWNPQSEVPELSDYAQWIEENHGEILETESDGPYAMTVWGDDFHLVLIYN